MPESPDTLRIRRKGMRPKRKRAVSPDDRSVSRATPHPAAKVPISRAEATDIRRSVRGQARGIVGTAAGAGERLSARALARLRLAQIKALQEALARQAHEPPKMVDSPVEPGKMVPAEPVTPDWVKATLSDKPISYENIGDFALGKSATNLLLHGDVSHPLAAGLELGTLLPVFRLGRLLGRGRRAAKAVEEVRAAETVSKGPKSPEAKVREALGPARRGRTEQNKLYSAERGARAGKAQAAYEAAGGGVAGQKAALGELKGELPRVQFQHLREGRITQEHMDSLASQIWEHPELQTYQKIHAMNGLLEAFNKGRIPQPSQIKLLQTVFGQDAAKELARISRARKVGQGAVNVLTIPRSLMASFDVSAPFRQGLVAGSRHPVLFSRNFAPMFKALTSEGSYQAILDEIHSRPSFQAMQDSGVKFTELGQDVTQREEQFMSNLAERIPVAGRGVRASGRAYTGFLDKMRADMFDEQVRLAAKAGVNVEDRSQLRSIARLVNSATGRGDLGPIESWAPAMNAMFFSPRLIASRVNMLNPLWYASLEPHARRQAIRSMVQLGAAASAVLGIGSYFGAKVGIDPRSADFAKLKIRDTRLDVLGGFQQYIRVGSQLATGQMINSSTGEISTIGTGPFQRTRLDILQQFAQGKYSPPVSFVNDFFKGTDFAGQPFSVKKEVLQRVVPLVAQDSYDLYHNTGSIPLALLGYAISAFGIGSQTYATSSTAQKKFKAWHSEAEKNWKALHSSPLPLIVVRAARDKNAVDALTRKLPGYGKKREGAAQIAYEHAELEMLFNYMRETSPQYSPELERLLDYPPIVIHNAIPQVRTRLYGSVLDQFNAQINAIKKRKTYG
jgi:hypothetical protein